MDIFEFAKSINYGADYLDPHTGYIYAITEVAGAYRFFGLVLPIPVYEDGKLIGYAKMED